MTHKGIEQRLATAFAVAALFIALTGVSVTAAQFPGSPTVSSVPVGGIVPFGGETAPPGWMITDGDTVSAAAFPELCTVLGDTYGPAPAGECRLPDLRGRVPVGEDGNAGRLSADNARGDSGGDEDVDFVLPAHTHSSGTLSADTAGSHSHGPGNLATNTTGSHTHGVGSLFTGGAGDHTHSIFAAGEHIHGAWIRSNVQGGGGTLAATTIGAATSSSPNVVQAGGSHTHGMSTAGGHAHSLGGSTASAGSHSHSVSSGATSTAGSHGHAVSGQTGSTGTGSGGSGPQANMQPYQVVNYIIHAKPAP